jgi:uncharacterized membrane protein YdjX (TVP38/TMEM64 family)
MRAPLLRLLLLVALVAAAFAAIALTGPLDAARVRAWVGGDRAQAAVLFVLLSACLTVACFPGPLLAAAAGALFGVVEGTTLAITAATLGAVLAFTVSRVVAGDAVRRLGGDRLQRAMDWIAGHGFRSILYARIAPGVPYTAVNYAAGLTPVAAGPFALATLIGCAPRAFAYAALGGNITNLGNPEALAALAVLVAMALAGVAIPWLGRSYRSKVPRPDAAFLLGAVAVRRHVEDAAERDGHS